MNNKALLIGNDINNATESYSWNDLIVGLLKYAKIDEDVNKENKPFPMLYEEIYLKSFQVYKTPESRIKKYIASQTRKLSPNILHRQILDLGIENILTTNYDLLFEESAQFSKNRCTNKGIIKETLYNLFRYHQTQNHKIWHIHGSETIPNSITLGYEHYSGYLQQMRNYVASGTTGTYKIKDFQPLAKRLRNDDVSFESWIDFFFTHDICIFGLNLDFVEMHLWWLLTYRARARIENRFPVNNSIVYYYPYKYQSTSRHKLEMFESLGINTKPIKLNSDDKIKYYGKVISDIKKGG